MKVFFIVDEFPFFLPEYLDGVVAGMQNKKEYTIVGITPLVTSKKQPTLYSYIIKQLPNLGLTSIVKLGFITLNLKLESLLYALKVSNKPRKISQVAKKYQIPVIHSTNVNSEKYLGLLRELDVDVIVSSCSQIFKKDILSLPRVSCINRHSSLLPSYGGLFPIFQAMIHDESTVGVTVHKMTTRIDVGDILSQKLIKIMNDDTLFSLYKKSYKKSVIVTLEAIASLNNKRLKSKKNSYTPSYFSFPTQDDWQQFWKKKKKII